MASFIYFYSKFTEEFLLLSAAGVFTLLSLYCYTWVVKKRRLGAARDQVPAGMVKIYLNQLINEAQFVRTQLFGLIGGVPPSADQFAAHFQAAAPQTSSTEHSAPVTPSAEIPSDLLDRLKALQLQLADKESMVVNINIERTKLLEEVENLRQNEKVMGSAATGNNEDLIQKIKALEERLEEYALFEDDLANLKRLQQENAQLKKQIDQGAPQVATTAQVAAAPTSRAEPSFEPMMEAVTPDSNSKESFLDQSAIDALLDGSSATPPTPVTAAPSEALEPAADQFAEPIAIAAKTSTQAPETAAAAKKGDEFENLVDSIEDSLSAKPAAQAAASTPATAGEHTAAASNAEKTDEELLKEFENLLNS
jgi:hypothetical protein